MIFFGDRETLSVGDNPLSIGGITTSALFLSPAYSGDKSIIPYMLEIWITIPV
jgi:hypothetical protein